MRLFGWLLVLAACTSEAPPAPVASASGVALPALTPGTEIVAAVGALSFREGKVLKVAGDNVTFEHGRVDQKTGAKPQLTMERARVWRMGDDKAAPGDHLVCRVAPALWLPCKVESREQSGVRASDAFGQSHRLAAGDLVRPDEERQKAIGVYLERESKHHAFDEAFVAAGAPARPDSYRPAKGDKVVVHFVGTSWYGATVVSTHKDEVLVHYDGKVFPDRDVALAAVAPAPRDAADAPVGAFVLVRPRDDSERWEHCKVLRVDGNDAEVIDRNGDKRKVARTDLLPIVR